jgi:hypothetical protein
VFVAWVFCGGVLQAAADTAIAAKRMARFIG